MSRSFESQGSLIGGDVREDEDPLKGFWETARLPQWVWRHDAQRQLSAQIRLLIRPLSSAG